MSNSTENSQFYDFHSHSHYSDGELSPQALLDYARERQIGCLALTDHDTVAGIDEAIAASDGIRVIPGVEISTSWRKHEIHVVGLNVDRHHESLLNFLKQQRTRRVNRAKEIALALEREGIRDAYEGVLKIACEDNIVRPHFAQFLVEKGYANTMQQAFDRYLKRGKVAYVPTKWPSLEKVIENIHEAGGLSVIAHPMRYKLTSTKLRLLLADFTSANGDGIEVITASHRPNDTHHVARLANEYGLLASQGSDFHGPSSFAKMGHLQPMPAECEPIWTRFDS